MLLNCTQKGRAVQHQKTGNFMASTSGQITIIPSPKKNRKRKPMGTHGHGRPWLVPSPVPLIKWWFHRDYRGWKQIFGTFGDHRMGYNGCVSNGVDGSNSFIAGLSDKSQRPLHLWLDFCHDWTGRPASLGYETPIYDNLDMFGTFWNWKGSINVVETFPNDIRIGLSYFIDYLDCIS